ncbi:MAG: hypothetical protein MJ161_05265 [Clostridia bacterium]|nr:hypothetical protein [Clostridia bacterium]
MMMSPETYYETELKGMTKDQLREEISELETEIAALTAREKELAEIRDPLERMMADPIKPDNGTRLAMNRQYLAKAMQALTEADDESK